MHRLIVTAPRQTEFEPISQPAYTATDLLVRTRITVISTGREIQVLAYLLATGVAGHYDSAFCPGRQLCW